MGTLTIIIENDTVRIEETNSVYTIVELAYDIYLGILSGVQKVLIF